MVKAKGHVEDQLAALLADGIARVTNAGLYLDEQSPLDKRILASIFDQYVRGLCRQCEGQVPVTQDAAQKKLDVRYGMEVHTMAAAFLTAMDAQIRTPCSGRS